MKINAETLYEVYKTTEINHASDLVIGLAMLRVKRTDITDEEDRALREFIGRHSQDLAGAYPDRDKFIAAVEAGIKEDEEFARKAAEAE